MKKLMFAAMAALAITSCSQNEEFDSPAAQNEIKFSSAAVTRANQVTTENFTKFITYGYSHAGDFAGTGTEMMGGVLFTGSGNAWSTTGKFYWPMDNNLSFFAYSTASDDPTKDGITYAAGTEGNYPTLTYVIKKTKEDQQDLIVAQATNKNKTNDAAGVTLTFKHALSQIAFSLKGDDSTVSYSVAGITVKGAKKDGTFTYGTTPATLPGTWVTGTETDDYTITFTKALAFTGGGAPQALAAGNEFILMPQKDLTGVTIDIAYTATNAGGKICDGVTGLKLPTTGIGSEWKVGTKTTYLLTLTPGAEVKLTGALDENEWTPETQN